MPIPGSRGDLRHMRPTADAWRNSTARLFGQALATIRFSGPRIVALDAHCEEADL